MIQLCNESEIADVIKTNAIVLIDFSATWCGPCKEQGKVLEKLGEKHPDIAIAKVDIDKSQAFARKMKISAVPTIIFFSGDKIWFKDKKRTYDRIVGLADLRYLERHIDHIRAKVRMQS